MSRYIDVEVLIDDLVHNRGFYPAMVASAIKNTPTADVVEVVRCKDCKYWGGITYGFVCRNFSGIDTKICMGADHYCSYGERKDDGT